MQMLQNLTGVTVAHLWEFATDRNASHVARKLLCIIAGRDVTPAQSAPAHSVDGAAFIRAAKVRHVFAHCFIINIIITCVSCQEARCVLQTSCI